jgi:hypothetical protein
LPVTARGVVARSWGRCYAAFGDYEGSFHAMLFDLEIPVDVRVQGWAGLRIEAGNDVARHRIAGLLERGEKETREPPVSAAVEELSGRLRK